MDDMLLYLAGADNKTKDVEVQTFFVTLKIRCAFVVSFISPQTSSSYEGLAILKVLILEWHQCSDFSTSVGWI